MSMAFIVILVAMIFSEAIVLNAIYNKIRALTTKISNLRYDLEQAERAAQGNYVQKSFYSQDQRLSMIS